MSDSEEQGVRPSPRARHFLEGDPKDVHRFDQSGDPRIWCRQSGWVVGQVHLGLDPVTGENVCLLHHGTDAQSGRFSVVTRLPAEVVLCCPAHPDGHRLPDRQWRAGRDLRL